MAKEQSSSIGDIRGLSVVQGIVVSSDSISLETTMPRAHVVRRVTPIGVTRRTTCRCVHKDMPSGW